MSSSKSNFRRHGRELRRSLGVATQETHAIAVCEHLRGAQIAIHFKTVFVYAADDGELDLSPTCQYLADHSVVVALPVIKEKGLCFSPVHSNSKMRQSRFGISEPISDVELEPDSNTLILLPMVAFDRAGRRLGRGGGYYDRYLAEKDEAILIGVAHGCQEVAHASANAWDIGMDGVVTESGWQYANERSRLRLNVEMS